MKTDRSRQKKTSRRQVHSQTIMEENSVSGQQNKDNPNKKRREEEDNPIKKTRKAGRRQGDSWITKAVVLGMAKQKHLQ